MNPEEEVVTQETVSTANEVNSNEGVGSEAVAPEPEESDAVETV